MALHGLLLMLVVPAIFGKYVYVEQAMQWGQARNHCQREYTDLAPINNELDSHLLFEETNTPYSGYHWIGLMRDPDNETEWLWSGGGRVQKTFWSDGEPNNLHGVENRGEMSGVRTWHDSPENKALTFFCYQVLPVRKRKTWDEALEYCRTHHRDLASVASETELMLIQKEMGKLTGELDEQVWIGLRFLAGEWIWVDGQPLEYEAWSLRGKPHCPAFNRGCAALRVSGTPQINTLGVDSNVEAWSGRSCDDELHFVCY